MLLLIFNLLRQGVHFFGSLQFGETTFWTLTFRARLQTVEGGPVTFNCLALDLHPQKGGTMEVINTSWTPTLTGMMDELVLYIYSICDVMTIYYTSWTCKRFQRIAKTKSLKLVSVCVGGYKLISILCYFKLCLVGLIQTGTKITRNRNYTIKKR